jgi:aryl-alcohol dehydrogenase-like predicted oxidoreductase
LPLCRQKGLGLLAWSPLAGGFLSGKYRRGEDVPTGTRLAKFRDRFGRFDNERGWGVLDSVRAVAKEVGASESQVALAWVLSKPAATSVIFGARSVAQLDENLPAGTLKLPAQALARLDEVTSLDLDYPYDFMSRTQGRW